MSENTARYQVRDPQGNVYGPAEAATLREWVRQGRIIAGMHIADQADGLWVEVTVHPALADLFHGANPGGSSAVAPAAAPVTPAGAAVSLDTPVATVAPAAPWASPTPVEQLPRAPVPGDPMAISSAYDRPQNNTLGLLSMIAGVIGVVCMPVTCMPICACFGGPLAGLMGLTAIVLGAIGMYQIKSQPARYTGRGMAVAGLCLGGGVLLLLVLIVIGMVMFGFMQR